LPAEDGLRDASPGLRWPKSAKAEPPPPARMTTVTATITSHLRRLRLGWPPCPDLRLLPRAARPPESPPAESGAVAWPLDGNVGIAAVGDEDTQPGGFRSPPGVTAVAVAGPVTAEGDGTGGDSSSGVASPAVSMPSRVSGAPQVPQNTASAGTGCPFVHVGTRIPVPSPRSGHARAIPAGRASQMTNCQLRSAPHLVQNASPGAILPPHLSQEAGRASGA